MKKCSGKKYSVNRVLALAMSLCMLFAMFDPGMMIYASEAGSDAPAGSGTAKSPYEIGTVEQLFWFADHVNQGNTGACAILTEDIDLKDRVWTPIAEKNAYTGTFDGKEHTISNLTLTSDGVSRPEGLFGVLGYHSTVKNINLENAVADGSFYIPGFIAGRSDGGHIIGCNVSGTLSASSLFLSAGGGGIVGSTSGDVKECTFAGRITAPAGGAVGGIAGENSGSIRDCVNKGTIEGKLSRDGLHMGTYMGGIVGDDQDSLIIDCRNEGTVTGGSQVGGIAGIIRGDSIVGDCVNTGSVSAEYANRVGGIAGETGSGTSIIECGNTGTIFRNAEGIESALAGGIVGVAKETSIDNCWNQGTIETADKTEAGGLVGQSNGSTISGCYTVGKVNGTGANTGAAIGMADENSVLSDIYYLEGSYDRAVGNVETAPEAVIAKQETAFHSGEVAWLLRGGRNSSPGWAQDLSDETSFPELLSGKTYIVRRVTDPEGTAVCFGNRMTLSPEELAKVFNIPEKSGYSIRFYVVGADGSRTFWQGTVDSDLTLEYQYEEFGEGTAESPYQIGSMKELLWFAEHVGNGNVDACAELVADINLAGAAWEPMCRLKNYVGVFDGKDHTIFNMTVTSENSYSTSAYAGLFGRVGKGGVVKNIKLEDAAISGGVNSAGFIASQNAGGTVENCTVSGDITLTRSIGGVGGVVGYNSGTVRGCAFFGTVTGEAKMGGIVGENGSYAAGFENATVEDCVNDGTILGELTSDGLRKSDNVGGIVGYNGQAGARIINCENHGKVVAGDYVGGIAGHSSSGYRGFSNLIEDCVNTGDVASEYGACAGGIVGYALEGNVIAKCGNSGAVSRNASRSTDSARVGGVVGHGIEITVENCWNQGSVDSAQWPDAGGLMGKSEQSHVKNCYTVGGVTGTGANSGMVIGNTDSASVFETIYYLDGTGAAVIGNAEADPEKVISAEKTAFVSGEVAWLLQKAQEDGAQVWGQDLTEAGYPMLSGQKEMAVHCIEDVAGGTYSYFNYPLGDVDGNSKITVYDALNILKYVVATAKFDDVQIKLGDVNRDGEVDVSDALNVLKMVAGVIPEFSAEIK